MSPYTSLSSGAQSLTRRSFVRGAASVTALAIASARGFAATSRSAKFSAHPFSLGVASGEPSPDGVVIWTRLAPRPLEPGGGMPPGSVEVSWQVAEDEAMSRVVRSGTATASEAWAHSVHVEVDGLRPDRWYWYWFKAGGEVSQKGRTRTAPMANAMPGRLRLAVANCQKYEVGYFTALEHLAREELDLVVHLGDYIYEGADDRAAVRPHGTPEAATLEAYRARYALYKLDPALQLAHAVAPWIVTWDDHEVSNNYAGEIPSRPERTTPAEFLQRRAEGYQAYYEHLPLRRSARPSGPDMQLYRRLNYGRLADFHVLDTRQYRTDQPLGDGDKAPTPVLMDPAGTILGERQRNWLFAGLERSAAAWNVLAQQVMVARVDHRPGPEVIHKMDKWAGYEFERRRLLRHFHDRRIRNPVVLTGDIHTNWANELIADFDELDSRSVGVEFVATSITSGGNGSEHAQNHEALLAENPFVKFHNRERGYVYCEATPDTWRADFRTVAYVDRPGAPLNTRASFVVESGRPVLKRLT